MYLLNLFLLILFPIIAAVNGDYTYDTKYIEVPLDHFSFSDNRTFTLRYLINDNYWKQNYGPIFFYAGNEGDIEMFAQNTGFLWETAEKFKALVVFAEHRYYGTSLPFGNLSLTDPKYFGYLTSQQALADYVDVLHSLKNYTKQSRYQHRDFNSTSGKRSNPVIVFGGSYGGMLAAWMRMKYPAVVEGALASSAPIWQFEGLTPCDSFYRVLTNAFNSSSETCVNNIRRSWKILRNALAEENGKQWIFENWKLCSPVNSSEDIKNLIYMLSEYYTSVGMVNYPYPTNFLMPLPGHPVNEMCKELNSTSFTDKELLMGVFKAMSVYFNYTGNADCFNWREDPSPDLGINGWNIQSCMEMVMPFCSNGKTDMFEPSIWDFQTYTEFCYDTYKVNPQQYYVEKEYGGKDLRAVSNIIFSNGLLDPWSAGGVTRSVSSSTVVLLLQDSAHHLDLRAANEEDPPSVVRARKLYMNIFRRWIRDYRKNKRVSNNEYDLYLETIF